MPPSFLSPDRHSFLQFLLLLDLLSELTHVAPQLWATSIDLLGHLLKDGLSLFSLRQQKVGKEDRNGEKKGEEGTNHIQQNRLCNVAYLVLT